MMFPSPALIGQALTAARDRWLRAEAHAAEFAALVATLLVLLALTLPLAALTVPSGANGVNRLIEACQRGARRGSLAVVGMIAGAALLAWALTVLSRIVWRGGRELRLIMRTSRALARDCDEVDLYAAGRLISARILPGYSTAAFTAGLIRPHVYIGRALLDGLSSRECDAVLLHEALHARRHDPLRYWLIELILSSIIWPGSRSLASLHRASCEADADHAAVAQMGDDRPLLRALQKADALAPEPGICALTEERTRALRGVRGVEAHLSAAQVAGLALGFGLISALLVLSVVGLTDWQIYWFCPTGTPMMG